MAGYVAFRAERCDMQAFTLTVCLSVCLTHICIHSHTLTPQGLPLITADLCTFRLWNDSRADQRTASHFPSCLIVSSLTLSDSSLHHLIRPSITPSLLVLLFLHYCKSNCQQLVDKLTSKSPKLSIRREEEELISCSFSGVTVNSLFCGFSYILTAKKHN